MITIANTVTNIIRTIIPFGRSSQPGRPQPLAISWRPLEQWRPAIIRLSPSNFAKPAPAARGVRSPLRTIASCVVCAAVFLSAMFSGRAQSSTHAPLNGTFANNGDGWNNIGDRSVGDPHVTTDSNGTTVARIGKDGSTPGKAGKSISTKVPDQCDNGSGNCGIKFHANFTQASNEIAKVQINLKNNNPVAAVNKHSRTGTIGAGSGNWVINHPDQCGDFISVIFWIESNGKPVQSTLDISNVVVTCDGAAANVLAMALPQFGDPTGPSYPLPLGGAYAGLPPTNSAMTYQCSAGLSPLADPFSSVSNSLDEVLPAHDQTIFYKYDPQSGSFDSYYRSSGQWVPQGGTFGPGDAAFIYSPVAQQFVFTGQYVPFAFSQHPSSGSAFFANTADRPASFGEVMGFEPVLGDVLVMFKHGDTNSGAPPGTPVTVFTYQTNNFALDPIIQPGETVQVIFADPTQVPLSILPLSLASGAPATNVLVTAPWGLPSDGILQISDSLGTGAPWKSLMGVADYYWEPATNSARWYRLGFNLPTERLYGYLMQSNGAPASGVSLQLAPNGAYQLSDMNGMFSFFDVPISLVDLEIASTIQVTTSTNSQTNALSSFYTVSLPVTIDMTQQSSVMLKENFVPQAVVIPNPASCPCIPWCGIVGGSVGGAQKVVAGGGSIPNPCPNGPATVTITWNGNVLWQGAGDGKPHTFSPAPNGVWKVTSTVCGNSKTSSITLP